MIDAKKSNLIMKGKVEFGAFLELVVFPLCNNIQLHCSNLGERVGELPGKASYVLTQC